MSTRTNFQHIGIGKVLETMTLEVPVNQRSYSWTDREIDDLWSDLKWAISAGEKEYFLGTIVLTVKENSRPLVVDGQQRLASVSMIYAGMRDYLLGIGEEPIAQDVEQFLTNTDRWTQTKSPKLTLSLQDDHFFQKHVLCRPDSVERKRHGCQPRLVKFSAGDGDHGTGESIGAFTSRNAVQVQKYQSRSNGRSLVSIGSANA